MMELTQQTILILFAAMAAAIFILFILCIVLFVKLNGQKKRYDYFMGSNRRPTHNLEMKIEEYFETSKKIESYHFGGCQEGGNTVTRGEHHLPHFG